MDMLEPDQLFSLAGKQALVTGGAKGLGRMIAEGLLLAGASVTITSRKQEACSAAAEELSRLGSCAAFAADLSSPDGVSEFAARYRSEISKLDILINNAGKTWSQSVETFPDKAWSTVMGVNVHAPFKLIQELLPLLAASAGPDDPARIINVGSIAGRVIEPLEAYSYSASKAAIHQLSRQLAADLADRHITVNAVLPGYFPTSMTAHLQSDEGSPSGMLEDHIPLGRFGRGSDIAGTIIYLASRAGSYVTGAEVVVDGGVTGCR